MKKLTPTRAKLPENERIIGGDAPNFTNKNRIKSIKSEYQKYLKNGKK